MRLCKIISNETKNWNKTNLKGDTVILKVTFLEDPDFDEHMAARQNDNQQKHKKQKNKNKEQKADLSQKDPFIEDKTNKNNKYVLFVNKAQCENKDWPQCENKQWVKSKLFTKRYCETFNSKKLDILTVCFIAIHW